MSGRSLEDIEWRSNCPISSALDLLGDKWSFLILRDLYMQNTMAFSDFLKSPERISTNILAARLKKLKESGLIEQVVAEGSRFKLYKLTQMGRDLDTVLMPLTQWSEKHLRAHHPEMVKVDP